MVLGFSTFHFSGLGIEENVLLEIDLTGKVVIPETRDELSGIYSRLSLDP
ncbi:hypothetical protein GCM10007931_01080 [Vibrio algivorus]|uniref:Uncharacterized protein n=1 Tax=Vibrio algivorus TaxID=1667024 RepID=A0ABQ6EJG5_9VIBR|nr:hypothetical protein GCM10007931_01080 [Vibrio algivorus]